MCKQRNVFLERICVFTILTKFDRSRFDQAYYEKPIKFEERPKSARYPTRLKAASRPRFSSRNVKKRSADTVGNFGAPDRIYRELFLKNHTQRSLPGGPPRVTFV
jgi:hypothetical protein